jgi:sugar phosphate isomerase/epimerase
MQVWRRAVACHCLSVPLRRAARTAAELGAAGLQFDLRNELRPSELSESGRHQLRHDLEIEGISIASFSFPMRRSLYDPEQIDARVSGLKQALEFAYQLRAPIVVARIGAVPADSESREYKLLVEVLRDVARHSNRVGATLAITPTRDTPDDLQTLLARIQEGPIGLNFDPASFAMSGQDAVAAYRQLHAQVLHITARDGVRDIDGTGMEVPLGTGDVDWPELLALIKEADYRGWITVDRTNSTSAAADAERALMYLKNVGENG